MVRYTTPDGPTAAWVPEGADVASLWAALRRLPARRVCTVLVSTGDVPESVLRFPWHETLHVDDDPVRASVDVGLSLARRPDAVYLLPHHYLHTPESLEVLLDGVGAAVGDYLTPDDDSARYGEGAPAHPGDGVVVTARGHWAATPTLPAAFCCRRGVLERDREPLRRLGERWAATWTRLRADGRRLRRCLPARATTTVAAGMAPGVDWARCVDRPATVPLGELRRSLDLGTRIAAAPDVAVLPDVSAEFVGHLLRFQPAARVSRVSDTDDVVAGGFRTIAVTNATKNLVDGRLRDGGRVETVLVEFADLDAKRSLRWVAGRDWRLPGSAGQHLV
jgi:hypothetical protein